MSKILIALFFTYSIAFACQLLTPTQFSDVMENKALYSVHGPVNNKKENYYEVKVFESKSLKGDAFRKRLAEHTKLHAKTMKPYGQLALVTYANDHQEFAFYQWNSKDAMEKASKEKGNLVKADADKFMKEVVSEQVNHDFYPLSMEYIKYQLGRTKNPSIKPPHSH